MLKTVDLNCDMGEVESANQDAEFMPFISSCSISCGAHAGTPDVIRRTIEAAMEHGVAIGAHPSYPDRENFGRVSLKMDPHALMESLREQLHWLRGETRAAGGDLAYVKPHGALYNDMYRDRELAGLVFTAILDADGSRVVYGRSGSPMSLIAEQLGLRFIHEAFADRRYEPNLALMSRSRPGAVLADVDEVLAQVGTMVRDLAVATSDGMTATLRVDSICIHGDSPGALEAARAIHAFLRDNDVRIVSPA